MYVMIQTRMKINTIQEFGYLESINREHAEHEQWLYTQQVQVLECKAMAGKTQKQQNCNPTEAYQLRDAPNRLLGVLVTRGSIR